MGDRIAVMNAGQIQQIAPPIELYNRPTNRFVAEFIGSPPMNFLTVQVETPLLLTHPEFQLPLPTRWGPVLQNHQGRSLWLGFRPEHLRIHPEPSDPSQQGVLRVQVERVEALGSETFVAVNWLENSSRLASPIQVRLSPDQGVHLGDRLDLSILEDKIHLFDPDTGIALRPD